MKGDGSSNLGHIDQLWRDMNMSITNTCNRNVLKKFTSGAEKARTQKHNRKTTKNTTELTNLLLVTTTSSDVKTKKKISVSKTLNRLSDENAHVRKCAAIELEKYLLYSNSMLKDGDIKFTDIAKQLFKRFNDPVEKVREVCIRISTKLFPLEIDLMQIIPYIIPAITCRINSFYQYDEEQKTFSRDAYLHDAFKRGRVYVSENQVARIHPSEPSEEIRLLFLFLIEQMLHTTFERQASSILHAYVYDIIAIAISGLHDTFHEIKVKSCSILTLISDNMITVMNHFSIAVIRSILPILCHRLSRVKIAAVSAIQALVSCPDYSKCKGSGTEAITDLIGHRDENVIPITAFYTSEIRINYLARLNHDKNPSVRLAMYLMICDWIVNLPDRYDYQSRLLPYVLSAVSDPHRACSELAIETLEKLGTLHENENSEEVIEMKQYGMDHRNPDYNYDKPLPPPFDTHGRPSLGARLYVRSSARRFLQPILRELQNWQQETQVYAMNLLKCVLIYSEESLTVDTHTLIQSMLNLQNHASREFSDMIQEITELIGRYTAPKTYLPFVLARIRGDEEVSNIIAPEKTYKCMETLYFLLSGSKESAVLLYIPDIIETISLPHIMGFESHCTRKILGKMTLQITELLQRRGRDAVTGCFLQSGRLPSLDKLYCNLFQLAVLFSTWSISDLQLNSQNILCHLAQLDTVADVKSVVDIYDYHFGPSFTYLADAVNKKSSLHWSNICWEYQCLRKILMTTRVTHLTQPNNLKAIVDFFATTLNSEIRFLNTYENSCASHQQLNEKKNKPLTTNWKCAKQYDLQMLLDELLQRDQHIEHNFQPLVSVVAIEQSGQNFSPAG